MKYRVTCEACRLGNCPDCKGVIIIKRGEVRGEYICACATRKRHDSQLSFEIHDTSDGVTFRRAQ
jgi:hypothetical protein